MPYKFLIHDLEEIKTPKSIGTDKGLAKIGDGVVNLTYSVAKSIYLTNNNELACNRVYHVSSIGTFKRYHTQDIESIGHHVLENQVLGKVIKVVDDNIWNSISISIWEISINNINVRALFTE